MSQPILVPQEIYSAPTPYQRQQPVTFTVQGIPGINLRDACNGNLTHLDNRLAPHTIDASRIGIRILWPGYRSWEFRNMSVVDNTVNSNTYSMERLLNTLANKIWLFYQEMSSPSAGVPLDKDWALRTVDFDRLFITELQHVSQGSWQPVLYYVPA